MKLELRRIASGVLVLTAILGILLGLHPLTTERLLSIYVLAVAAVALAALTRVAQTAEERRRASAFDAALAKRGERPMRPPELVRTERELALGIANAGHLQRRLLPFLRDAAAARLAQKHGVELERRPEAARDLLGQETWELLRPDRPEPADRNAPGISFARLKALVDRLEAL